MREWDCNSRLFHRIVSCKHVNKLIIKLEKEDGSIGEREEEIVSEIVSYFQKLYSKREVGSVGLGSN